MPKKAMRQYCVDHYSTIGLALEHDYPPARQQARRSDLVREVRGPGASEGGRAGDKASVGLGLDQFDAVRELKPAMAP
jgi:hypothetical protein